MDRRQFLHALPASALGNFGSSSNTQMLPSPALDGGSVPTIHAAPWAIPKIGIVSVGGIGGPLLPTQQDRTQVFPYVSRTVAVHTTGVELHFMGANCKLLLGDSKTLLNPHTAGLLAESCIPEIASAVAGLDMVFLQVGMAGATGAGVAPVVARELRKQGTLTIAFAVMPFGREGAQRQHIAQAGMRELRPHVDALLKFENEDIEAGAKQSLWPADPLRQMFMALCRNIVEPVCRPGMVNVDFEDLRHLVLSLNGECAIGYGSAFEASGAATVVDQAINHPLLGPSRLRRASAVLVAISGPLGAKNLEAIKIAVSKVRAVASPDACFLYGVTPDHANSGNQTTVAILANGIL